MGVVLILMAYGTVSDGEMADRLVALYGADSALQIAKSRSTSSLVVDLVPVQLKWASIYLGAGIGIGLIARVAVAQWTKPMSVKKTDKVAVEDEAGGRYVMYGVPFAHAPHAPKCAVTPIDDVEGIDQASLLEYELLGAYKASGCPADTMGYHGVSLYEHCLGVWRRAVSQYGYCSLEALLAVSHDAGKLISFQAKPDGSWVRLTPRHEMYNAEALRRLPSYWSVSKEERDLIGTALAFMAGTIAAKDVSSDIVQAVQHVHVLDIKTTSTEVAQRRAGEIDNSQIIQAVIDLAKEPPADWNVNRTQASGSPAGAIHLGNGVLLVSGRVIRNAIAKRIDNATASALALTMPSTEWHQSYEAIADALQKAGLGQRIVSNVASESGWFSVRVGAAKMPHAIAIKTDTSPAQQKLWGANSLEIVLTEVSKA